MFESREFDVSTVEVTEGIQSAVGIRSLYSVYLFMDLVYCCLDKADCDESNTIACTRSNTMHEISRGLQ